MRRLLLLALALLPGLVAAHDARPIYLTLEQMEASSYRVSLSVPNAMTRDALPELVLPAGCRFDSPLRLSPDMGAYTGTRTVACGADLAGQELSLSFPVVNPSLSLLIRFQRLNGESYTEVLPPGEARWTVPDEETASGVAASYLQLGVRHIWEGIDHLLFVTCLIFIARTWRRILITITGFTVAHSITLALAALDIIRVPVPPVEAAIALSVLLLAVEIAEGDRSTLTQRFPIAVASSFGLLHGLGFAAVLAETGLPQTEVPLALLFFNLGVEVGQILFVVALVLLWQLVAAALSRVRERGLETAPTGGGAPTSALDQLALPASYVVGVTAAWWTLDRIAGF